MRDTVFLPAELGQQLRRVRESHGLTVKSLAEKAGKSRPVIYRLENGEESSLSSFLAVAAALGLTIQLVRASLPTLEETAGFFTDDAEHG
jgi:HTH-type transcriptional regulator / antitoxin HipB